MCLRRGPILITTPSQYLVILVFKGLGKINLEVESLCIRFVIIVTMTLKTCRLQLRYKNCTTRGHDCGVAGVSE